MGNFAYSLSLFVYPKEKKHQIWGKKKTFERSAEYRRKDQDLSGSEDIFG